MQSYTKDLTFYISLSDEHSGKVKSFMLDVLSPLITEADFVSNEPPKASGSEIPTRYDDRSQSDMTTTHSQI